MNTTEPCIDNNYGTGRGDSFTSMNIELLTKDGLGLPSFTTHGTSSTSLSSVLTESAVKEASEKLRHISSEELQPSSEQKKRRPKAKTVRFENIEVREYNVVIGDNPSCRSGCPIRYVT